VSAVETGALPRFANMEGVDSAARPISSVSDSRR
jgi:hypothetical protein